jgi:hypothetical protein
MNSPLRDRFIRSHFKIIETIILSIMQVLYGNIVILLVYMLMLASVHLNGKINCWSNNILCLFAMKWVRFAKSVYFSSHL